MSDDANQVRRLLGILRDRPISVDSERLAARRERVVSSLKRDMRALAGERVWRKRRRAAYVALSLAAAAGALLGVHRFAQSSPQPTLAITFVGSVGQATARSGAFARALHAGEALSNNPGEIVSAVDGSAELVTSAGLGLQLGSATRVSLAGLFDVNQVQIEQGLLTCSVPHMKEGQHFSVQTPDARVVVHGTVFSVRVDAQRAPGEKTCVEVTDGVVVVQHDGNVTALNRGDRWGCEASARASLPEHPPLAPAPASQPEDKAAEVAEPHALPRSNTRNTRNADRGTLGEERRLFQAALTAERVGQPELAQSLLEQLLGRYPSSPLAAEARRAASRIAGGSAAQ